MVIAVLILCSYKDVQQCWPYTGLVHRYDSSQNLTAPVACGLHRAATLFDSDVVSTRIYGKSKPNEILSEQGRHVRAQWKLSGKTACFSHRASLVCCTREHGYDLHAPASE